MRRKYRGAASVGPELEKLRGYWDETLGRFSAQTPDAAVNAMVNVWNPYQCRTTFNWSRSASYYESGIGRGMGFRDSNQDILGFAHQIPSLARQRLLDIAATQFPEGRAHHQYSPLTKKGNGEGFGDDHLWLIIAVSHYMKETGDLGVLDEPVPYNDGTSGSLYEHMRRALDYSWSATGWHGLPKIGNADWNDCLNLKGPNGTAVSVMIAEMFVMAAGLMADIAGRTGRAAEKTEIETAARRDERQDQRLRLGRAVVRTRLRRQRRGRGHRGGRGGQDLAGVAGVGRHVGRRRTPNAPGRAWTAWPRTLPPARESSSLRRPTARTTPSSGTCRCSPRG